MSALPMGLDINTVLLVIFFPLVIKNMQDVAFIKGELKRINGKK